MRTATTVLMLTFSSALAAQTVPKPDGAWRGSIGASLSSSSGNNEATSVSFNADAVRQRDHDKLVASILSLYSQSETDGVEETTASRTLTKARYDRDFSDLVFGFLGYDLEKDKLADLKWRSSPSVGAGLHLVKTETTTFDVFGGYSYNREELYAGVDRSFDEALLGEESTHKLSEDTSFRQRLVVYPNLSESGEYRVVFDAGFLSPLIGKWNLSVNLSARYQSNPPLGIEDSDTLLVAGLQYRWGPK